METIERVVEIMVTIEEFSELLDHETAAIRAADSMLIAKMSERKQFLTLHYQRQLQMLSDRRDDLAELDPGVREALTRSFKTLSKKIDANVLALEVAQHATRSVVEMIISAIRTQGMQESVYKGSGLSGKSENGSRVSIVINKVL